MKKIVFIYFLAIISIAYSNKPHWLVEVDCEDNNEFYSRNYNFNILPEGLNNYHEVKYIVRKSTKKENHKKRDPKRSFFRISRSSSGSS